MLAVAAVHGRNNLAIITAQAKTARARQKLIDQYAADKPYWLHYAAVAWTARTLALAEYIERSDLHMSPKEWAAQSAFQLMDNFEEDETWLWPFDSESPQEELDDEDDDLIE